MPKGKPFPEPEPAERAVQEPNAAPSIGHINGDIDLRNSPVQSVTIHKNFIQQIENLQDQIDELIVMKSFWGRLLFAPPGVVALEVPLAADLVAPEFFGEPDLVGQENAKDTADKPAPDNDVDVNIDELYAELP